MDVGAFLSFLETSPLALAIQTSDMFFPLLESLHVVGVALVFGTIFIVDMRLLGLASRGQSVIDVTRTALRWTWLGFILALVTGTLMFVSTASVYMNNAPFLFKMGLLAVAGVNMLTFEVILARDIETWADRTVIPMAARLSGGLSLLCWITILALGRWIGFT